MKEIREQKSLCADCRFGLVYENSVYIPGSGRKNFTHTSCNAFEEVIEISGVVINCNRFMAGRLIYGNYRRL